MRFTAFRTKDGTMNNSSSFCLILNKTFTVMLEPWLWNGSDAQFNWNASWKCFKIVFNPRKTFLFIFLIHSIRVWKVLLREDDKKQLTESNRHSVWNANVGVLSFFCSNAFDLISSFLCEKHPNQFQRVICWKIISYIVNYIKCDGTKKSSYKLSTTRHVISI